MSARIGPSTIYAADLYCGAGGASAGLYRAADKIGAAVHLVAVNHWDVAIATHSANYPGAKHHLTEVERVNPREAVPGGRLTLLLAGPSCVHFSQARGGRPVSDQQRSGAWDVIRWARELLIENILVENVPEFLTWGPVDTADGRPCKERKGLYFRQWCRMLTDMGYTVEHRVLCAAHYGDATTRKRLFIQARRTGRITWPKPTHHAPAELSAYPGTKPWRSAREIIDWSIPGTSIFGRKKELCDNTKKRIFAGLQKFCGLSFVIGQQSCAAPRGVDDPIPTVSTAGAISLVEPFLVILKGTAERQLDWSAQSVDSPVPSLTTGGNVAVCEPFILPQFSTALPRSVDRPMHTIVTQARGNALIQPFLVGVGGPVGGQSAKSLDVPMGTLLGQNHQGLCQPFLVRYNGVGGDRDRNESIDLPLTTIDTSNRLGLAQPFLINYYGTGGAESIADPLDTVTTKDRFALIEPLLDKGDRVALLDIRFRMLQPHELAAAHSFPADYQFSGGREDRVKQVGNSWPCRLSEALCMAVLTNQIEETNA